MILLPRRRPLPIHRQGNAATSPYVRYYGRDVSVLDPRLQAMISIIERGSTSGSGGSKCYAMVQYGRDPRRDPAIVVTPYHTHQDVYGYRDSTSGHIAVILGAPIGGSTLWGLGGSTLVQYVAGASVDTTSECGTLLYAGRYAVGVGLNVADAGNPGNELLGLIEAQTWIDGNISVGTGFKHFMIWPVFSTTYVWSSSAGSYGLSPSVQASAMESNFRTAGTRSLTSGLRMAYAAVFYANDQTATDQSWNRVTNAMGAVLPATSTAGTGHPNLQVMAKHRTYFIPEASAAAVVASFARARAIRAQQHLLIR